MNTSLLYVILMSCNYISGYIISFIASIRQVIHYTLYHCVGSLVIFVNICIYRCRQSLSSSSGKHGESSRRLYKLPRINHIRYTTDLRFCLRDKLGAESQGAPTCSVSNWLGIAPCNLHTSLSLIIHIKRKLFSLLCMVQWLFDSR